MKIMPPSPKAFEMEYIHIHKNRTQANKESEMKNNLNKLFGGIPN